MRRVPVTRERASRRYSEPFDPASFARQLAAWFARAQRDLPWRWAANARDPYRVLVSEVMLQQTTVAAARPFYERFVARFPDVPSLAEAPLDEVLSLWAGLGYYQRARSLHACARAIVERHGGVFPHDFEALLALPGVGRYTAGAVASIAFDQPAPIVDANVARVLSRIFCLEDDPKTPANQRRLWHEARRIVASCDAACRPSQVNPALMELGALICTPVKPRCEVCPVAQFCAARAAGRQNEIPHAAPKPSSVELRDACAFVRRGDEILLRQRPHEAKIWWRGLWELPRVTARAGESGEAALHRLLREELGVAAHLGAHLKTLRHGVTHHHITLDCWAVTLAGEPRGAQWVTWPATEQLAMPSVMRRLLAWLRTHTVETEQLTLL